MHSGMRPISGATPPQFVSSNSYQHPIFGRYNSRTINGVGVSVSNHHAT